MTFGRYPLARPELMQAAKTFSPWLVISLLLRCKWMMR
jgi:hypothetical protein